MPQFEFLPPAARCAIQFSRVRCKELLWLYPVNWRFAYQYSDKKQIRLAAINYRSLRMHPNLGHALGKIKTAKCAGTWGPTDALAAMGRSECVGTGAARMREGIGAVRRVLAVARNPARPWQAMAARVGAACGRYEGPQWVSRRRVIEQKQSTGLDLGSARGQARRAPCLGRALCLFCFLQAAWRASGHRGNRWERTGSRRA